MNSPAVVALLATWRARAEEGARLDSMVRLDKIVRAMMAELEETTRRHDDELLDLTTAAKESGYSDRALRAKITAGELENRGRKHAPRVRRGDLPKRSIRTIRTPKKGAYDPTADALSLVRRG